MSFRSVLRQTTNLLKQKALLPTSLSCFRCISHPSDITGFSGSTPSIGKRPGEKGAMAKFRIWCDLQYEFRERAGLPNLFTPLDGVLIAGGTRTMKQFPYGLPNRRDL